MNNSTPQPAVAILLSLVLMTVAVHSTAEGESDGSFPTWDERWIHQLINRARCDPQHEMDDCGSACAEAACYSPKAPLPWTSALNRAARFHSSELALQGYFNHPSQCTVVSNISSIYPNSCDGSASCACVGGISVCAPVCTTASVRVGLFGSSNSGEIIASTGGGANSAFYVWLFEPTGSLTCNFTQENGHRWLILKGTSAVGIGKYGSFYTGDFGNGSTPGKVPSGSHYPQQASTVELWANWYDSSGPSAAAVSVEGVCLPMSLERGSTDNGSWMAEASGVGSGCHRYYFEFQDSAGSVVTYPTTGSLAIGTDGSCPTWDGARPDTCLAAVDTIFADGFETGNTARWSNTVPSS